MIDTEVKATTLLSPAKNELSLLSEKKERTLILLSEVHSRDIEGIIYSVHDSVSFLLGQTKCHLTGGWGQSVTPRTHREQSLVLDFWFIFLETSFASLK